MKNAFQKLLAIAVAGLYVLHFIGNDAADSIDSEAQEGTSSEFVAKKVAGKIAYVNTDSLWQAYDYYQEMKDDLIKEKEVLERQYENKVRKFQDKVARFQEKAPYLSQREGERQQTAIVQEEQEIVQLQEELTLQLAESEAEKNKAIRKRIVDEIENYNQQVGLDFILGYSLSSDVIYADTSLDITSFIVERLNQKYASQKAEK